MGDDGAGFMAHWLDIEPERMERYETMYRWSDAAERFYAGAGIGPGQVVADFGCGPGHAAMVFAGRVGPAGHVHALDINAEFVRRTWARAAARGLAGRVTVHLLTGPGLPLRDECLDRVTARNTVIYVPDPVATLGEFRRCLRPGGLAHVIEGDWALTAVEPLGPDRWRALVEAASWAWPHPTIGRRLHACARQAGFGDVRLQVLTEPDTTGRLTGMIRTVAGYARQGGQMAEAEIDAMLADVEGALAAGRYLAVSPQFVMTARG